MELEEPNNEKVEIRPGTRYRCPDCTTEVVVVKGDVRGRLACGGIPMANPAAAASTPGGAPPGGNPTDSEDPEATVLLGKRYGDPGDMVEVLCTKAGSGPLSLDGAALSVKAPKPLPASD